MSMPKQPPSTRTLGNALDEFLDHLGLRKKVREYDAVIRWEGIVGKEIAKVTTAVKIEKGVLTVRVSNSPWRNELVLLKRDLIGKMNDALGEAIVQDIRFV